PIAPAEIAIAIAIADLVAGIGQSRHRHDALALVDFEHSHTTAAPPPDADIVDRNADELPEIGDQHDLVVVIDREDRDRRTLSTARIVVLAALRAAAGDRIIIGRAALAEAFLGEYEHKFLARGKILVLLFADLRDNAFVLAFFGTRCFRFFGRAATLGVEAEESVTLRCGHILMPQD